MKAVVTGAAGFIGSHLTERLLADGASVVGVDSFTDYYNPGRKRANLRSALEDPDFTLVEGGLTELELGELLGGVDTVFHLAGQPGVRVSWGKNFDVYARDNVLATQKVLEAVKEHPIERLVYASSSSIYGDAETFPTPEEAVPAPVSPYGVSKLAGEHLCRLYARSFGVRAVALRYFSVYGPRQRPDMAFSRFIDYALRGEPVTVYGDGQQQRDFTFVGDVVQATVAAATMGPDGATYNVAGGSQVTVLGAIDAIEAALGTPIEIDYQHALHGDPRRTGGDTDAARRALDYVPATEFVDGIAAQVDERIANRA
jgi:nucleoside-diphosphate-sugar epimerase